MKKKEDAEYLKERERESGSFLIPFGLNKLQRIELTSISGREGEGRERGSERQQGQKINCVCACVCMCV
jgi:hypothetical protein